VKNTRTLSQTVGNRKAGQAHLGRDNKLIIGNRTKTHPTCALDHRCVVFQKENSGLNVSSSIGLEGAEALGNGAFTNSGS